MYFHRLSAAAPLSAKHFYTTLEAQLKPNSWKESGKNTSFMFKVHCNEPWPSIIHKTDNNKMLSWQLRGVCICIHVRYWVHKTGTNTTLFFSDLVFSIAAEVCHTPRQEGASLFCCPRPHWFWFTLTTLVNARQTKVGHSATTETAITFASTYTFQIRTKQM